MNIVAIAEQLSLDEDEYIMLLSIFVKTGLSDLDKLQSAIENSELERAHELIHSFKGTTSCLGLIESCEIVMTIEKNLECEEQDNLIVDLVALRAQLLDISELVREFEQCKI